MKTLFDATARDALRRRAARLSASQQPLWGRMSAPQMLVHLTDALRMGTGELATAPKNVPLRYTPLKQLVIYWLPWPKGAPTAPELLARGRGDIDFGAELTAFDEALESFGRRTPSERWPEHPAFGALSPRAWGVLGWRHVDHHLRQFGV